MKKIMLINRKIAIYIQSIHKTMNKSNQHKLSVSTC